MNLRAGPPLWACALVQAVLLVGLWVALAVMARPRLAAITSGFIAALAVAALGIGFQCRRPAVLAIAFAALLSVGLILNLAVAVTQNTLAVYVQLQRSLTGAEQIMLAGTISLLIAVGFSVLWQAWVSIGKLLPQGWATPLWGGASPQKVRPLRRIG